MTRDGSRRRSFALPLPALARFVLPLGLLAGIAAAPPGAQAQAIDCTRLRAEIDSIGDGGRFDVALRQQREELARTRAYADQSGCSGNGFFDDPDSLQCRALARRIGTLEVGLQRLQDQAFRGDPATDDRRQTLTEAFNAECTPGSTEAEPPPSTIPVDPDARAPVARSTSARVLCVRHCDGAYYPLAVDVASDRMGDMDRICQAQCPAATASAYGGDGSDDVSGALASDGTRYAALATAFQFRKGPVKSCACRAPHQSWAEALAGAEALLEPHKGDVTVTAALSAAMAQPVMAPQKASPASAKPPAPVAKKATRQPASGIVPPVPPPEPGGDLTRAFRRSAPTL